MPNCDIIKSCLFTTQPIENLTIQCSTDPTQLYFDHISSTISSSRTTLIILLGDNLRQVALYDTCLNFIESAVRSSSTSKLQINALAISNQVYDCFNTQDDETPCEIIETGSIWIVNKVNRVEATNSQDATMMIENAIANMYKYTYNQDDDDDITRPHLLVGIDCGEKHVGFLMLTNQESKIMDEGLRTHLLGHESIDSLLLKILSSYFLSHSAVVTMGCLAAVEGKIYHETLSWLNSLPSVPMNSASTTSSSEGLKYSPIPNHKNAIDVASSSVSTSISDGSLQNASTVTLDRVNTRDLPLKSNSSTLSPSLRDDYTPTPLSGDAFEVSLSYSIQGDKGAAGERYLYYAAERTRLQNELDESMKYAKSLEIELEKLKLAGNNPSIPTTQIPNDNSNVQAIEIERLRKAVQIQASALVDSRSRYKDMAEKAQGLEISLLGERQIRRELETEKQAKDEKLQEISTQTDPIVPVDVGIEDFDDQEGQAEGDGSAEGSAEAIRRIEDLEQQLQSLQEDSAKVMDELKSQVASTKQRSEQIIESLTTQLSTTKQDSQKLIEELKEQLASSTQTSEPLEKQAEELREALAVEKEHAASAQKQYVDLSVETQRLKRHLASLERDRKELIEALFQITNDRLKDENAAAIKRGTIQDILGFYGIKLNGLKDLSTSNVELAATNLKPSAPVAYIPPPPRTTSSSQSQASAHNNSTSTPASTNTNGLPTPTVTPERKLHGILKNSQASNGNKAATIAMTIEPPAQTTSLSTSTPQPQIAPVSNKAPRLPSPVDMAPMMAVGPGSEAWDAVLQLLDQTEKASTIISHIRRPSDASENSIYDVYSIKPRTSSLEKMEPKTNAKNHANTSATAFGLKLKLPFGKENRKLGSKNVAIHEEEENDEGWAPMAKTRRPLSSVKEEDDAIEEEILGKKVTFAK